MDRGKVYTSTNSHAPEILPQKRRFENKGEKVREEVKRGEVRRGHWRPEASSTLADYRTKGYIQIFKNIGKTRSVARPERSSFFPATHTSSNIEGGAEKIFSVVESPGYRVWSEGEQDT